MLSSSGVNVIALGAFWISPGLRTIANRFVINLLVVNVFACIVLVPALWLNGGLKTTFYNQYDDDDDNHLLAAHAHRNHHHSLSLRVSNAAIRDGKSTNIANNERRMGANYSNMVLQSIESTIIEHETKSKHLHESDEIRFDCHRFWGFDLAATLGMHKYNINDLQIFLILFTTWTMRQNG